MSHEIQDIVLQIDRLASVGNVEDLRRLEQLVDRYFTLPGAADHLDVWFRLFERFPDDDGYGVFWCILHAVEALPGSDAHVVESVGRWPTQFPLLMVNSMLNAGVYTVGDVSLMDLLRRVATDDRASADVRRDADRYLRLQVGASASPTG